MNECKSRACGFTAVCMNTIGSFTCICPLGYEYDGTNCLDINECGDGSASCSENSDCVNTEGGFVCQCHAGFTNVDIETDQSGGV